MKEDGVYIQHIIESIQKINEYIKNTDKNKFLSNSMIQDAVIRQIEIIGEAAKNISSSTKKKNEIIPWKDISGMRDKLIHGYFGVDLDAVWKTVKKDIPILEREILKL